MTTLTFTDERCETSNGDFWLCLKVTDPAAARRFVMGVKGGAHDCEIKEHREKRSLDANRYLWELIGKLSDALRTTKEELYLDYIRKYGLSQDWELPEKQAKTFCITWSKQGMGWPTERVDYADNGKQIIRAYYGSSCYNTKQMSRLLDAVIEDCKEQGIETLPPDKIAAMKEDWRGAA